MSIEQKFIYEKKQKNLGVFGDTYAENLKETNSVMREIGVDMNDFAKEQQNKLIGLDRKINSARSLALKYQNTASFEQKPEIIKAKNQLNLKSPIVSDGNSETGYKKEAIDAFVNGICEIHEEIADNFDEYDHEMSKAQILKNIDKINSSNQDYKKIINQRNFALLREASELFKKNPGIVRIIKLQGENMMKNVHEMEIAREIINNCLNDIKAVQKKYNREVNEYDIQIVSPNSDYVPRPVSRR